MEWEIFVWALIIFLAVVLAKILSKKTSTVDVLWLIVIWAILSNFGYIPKDNEILTFIWELWIIFVMFALWFEEDLRHFLRSIKKSWWVAIFWAMAPFCAWYFTAIYLWNWPNEALLWWLTMTATAVSLTMMSLRNQGLSKSLAATWIMTAAVIDDILSLIWVAIIVPLAVASKWDVITSWQSLFNTIWIISGQVWIFFLIAIMMRILIFHDRESQILIVKYPFLKHVFKFVNNFFRLIWVKKILAAYEWEFTPLVLLTMAMWMGTLAHVFWFHPAIWAYIAWLILQKHHFHHWDKSMSAEEEDEIYEKSKFVVDHVAFTIFWPIFFVTLWSQLIIYPDIILKVLPWVLMLFSLVFVLQILSASFSARFIWKYKWYNSIMIWFWMLWRAELAFIVINIAYVQTEIIDSEQFYILIFTTFLLNISVPIMIKFWEPYYQGRKTMKLFGTRISK